MNRRSFLATVAGTGVGLAGCLSRSDEGGTTTDDPVSGSDATTTDRSETDATATTTATSADLSGTLTVATYTSFVDAPSVSPGDWLTEEFEKRNPDVTVEWTTPENRLNHYVERQRRGSDFDADLWMGLKVPELVQVRGKAGDTDVFAPTDLDGFSNADAVDDRFFFDPEDAALPVFTGYQSLVYDAHEVGEPQTFDDLTTPAYEGDLLTQNPQSDNTGLYFLLWTIDAKGEDGYLDYWQALVDNGVHIHDTWSDAYGAYSSGEAPIITSFSTDQVYAARSDADMQKHRIGFLDGEAYANLSGMARFAGADNPDLARAFMDFMLSPAAQTKLMSLNVSFPVAEPATTPENFAKYAKEPDDPVLFTYDELDGKVQGWVDDWAREVAAK